MQSMIKRAGLLAAAFVVCLGGSARAATIEVKVPFPFLVHGKTLPLANTVWRTTARSSCSAERRAIGQAWLS